ncbi:MAG TPA: sensor histidine kinase [Nitrospirae bacterium]|nr:sensor histidine kinase [Nitrospirota bacterium]
MKIKIALIFLLLIIISIIVTLNIFFQQNYEAEMAAQFNQQQLIIAKTLSDSIQTNLRHLIDEASALVKLLSSRGLHQPGLEEFVNYAFAELSTEIGVEMIIVDENNTGIYQTRSGVFTQKTLLDLTEKIRNLHSSNFYFMEDVPQRRLIFGFPVKRKDVFIGATIITVNISEICNKFLTPIQAGKRGYAWMMDASGTLLYHPTQPEMIGRNIFNADRSCYRCHKSFKTEIQILSAKDIGFSSYIAPYGEDKLVAFSRVRLPSINWIVCVSIPYSEVTQSIKNSMRFHSLLVFTILIATGIVSFIIIIINKERVKAEEKALYSEKIKAYAKELENIVNERTRELKLEKEKLDAIVSSIEAGICIFDENEKAVWLNRVMRKWLSPEKQKDLTLRKLFEGQRFLDNIHSAVVDNRFVQEVSFLDLGNKKGYFQMVATPIHSPDGKAQIMILLQDVTELKRAQEQLMQSEKLSALARLSAGVAHEIGNPLTSISSYVQILKDMDFDDFTKEALETISRHINRIATIVRQMSRFSKTQAEEIKNVKIPELVNSTLELVKYDKRTKNIEIELHFPEDLPEVYVDGNQMIQVFMNLILNAADAMPDGGRLTISARPSDSKVEIAFTDTGHGIDKEHLDRIFDPFFTTKEKGSGLGLAVSYSIVKSFGGDIVVESAPGKGSTFKVILPAYEG